MKRRLIIALSLFQFSCSTNSGVEHSRAPAETLDSSYSLNDDLIEDGLDTLLGESYEGGSHEAETSIINGIAATQSRVLSRTHPQPPVPRDVHKRAHGCLYGNITIENSRLPPELKTGVFAENGKVFRVWSRFSNNNQSTTLPDSFPDIRGLGLKLMGVRGPKILSQESAAETQDFLFLGTPKFFVKDNANYGSFLEAFAKYQHAFWLLRHDRHGLRSIIEDQVRLTARYTNPLDVPYFTSTPYRLGNRDNPRRAAVKYRVTRVLCPAETAWFRPSVSRLERKYMRNALRQSMSARDACLDLSVQIRPEGLAGRMQSEDSSVEWASQPTGNSLHAPFIKVASLNFPAQEFDNERQDLFCENLQFTPWHSLAEHRPLGRVNRARRVIYQQLSQHRQRANGIRVYQEPTDYSIDAN